MAVLLKGTKQLLWGEAEQEGSPMVTDHCMQGKGDANRWVKQLKVKNKCNLSHASAITSAADHVAVMSMCLCLHA